MWGNKGNVKYYCMEKSGGWSVLLCGVIKGHGVFYYVGKWVEIECFSV